MTLHSRIDIIGQNGNDGLHYLEEDIVDRLEHSPRVNGFLMKDIQDAINEIKSLRVALKNLYKEQLGVHTAVYTKESK